MESFKFHAETINIEPLVDGDGNPITLVEIYGKRVDALPLSLMGDATEGMEADDVIKALVGDGKNGMYNPEGIFAAILEQFPEESKKWLESYSRRERHRAQLKFAR